MKKPNLRKLARTSLGQFLWLIVLCPVLAVSAFSMFWIARSFGIPPWIAFALSTCFDGVVLLAADYGLKYAQAGASGALPRAVVVVWAGIAAYVQTFHARLAHEPAGSWVLWASLPVAAVLIYEIHMRWAKRKGLAAAGRPYPAPLPAFGLATWVMFPIKSWFGMRAIVGKRREAIERAVAERPVLVTIIEPKVVRAKAIEPDVAKEQKEIRRINEQRSLRGPNAHSPVRHIRAWAQEQGIPVSDRARLPADVIARYEAAQRAADKEASDG